MMKTLDKGYLGYFRDFALLNETIIDGRIHRRGRFEFSIPQTYSSEPYIFLPCSEAAKYVLGCMDSLYIPAALHAMVYKENTSYDGRYITGKRISLACIYNGQTYDFSKLNKGLTALALYFV
jgi:hypothetical protein